MIVRGRLDHKGRGDTKLVAQEVELFQPTEDEVAKARAARERDSGPLRLHIDASAFGVSVIEELKAILAHFPGDSEVLLVMKTRAGRPRAAVRARVPRPPLGGSRRRARRAARRRRPRRLEA